MREYATVEKNLVAKAAIAIAAPKAQVWKALTDPAAIKEYMFGTTMTTDWREGGPITWSGEWQGRHYEDKGRILRVVPERTLQYTHYSPLTGLPDTAENYHRVTVELIEDGGGTQVSLSQDNNHTDDGRAHSEKNWMMMLTGLKKYVEEQAGMRR